MRLLPLALLLLPLAGCGSSSDDAPPLKGDPPPVVASPRDNAPEHVRGGRQGGK